MTDNDFIDPDQIHEFVKTRPDYYVREFQKINNSTRFVFSLNLAALLLGSIWFGIRNIWNWALAFLLIETFAIVQVVRGLFGNISAEAYQKIDQIQSTIDFRQKQLEAAIESNSDKVDVFERTIKSLEDSIAGYLQEAQRIEALGLWIAVGGIVLFLSIRIFQGVSANTILEKRFSEWVSDRSISPGMMMRNVVSSTVFAITIIVLSTIHYSFPNLVALFADFPTHPDIRLLSIDGVENGFDYAVVKGDAIFTAITIGIRSVLDSLEMLFVKTPWIVVIGAIAVMTGLSAGPRAAIYSVAFLAYMGLLGFWIKAMTTLALLGTAAILSISIGIPLGIYCSTRPRFYAFIRPIMDFMQTMPAFVFMIPVCLKSQRALIAQQQRKGWIPVVSYPSDSFLGQVMEREIFFQLRAELSIHRVAETSLTLAILPMTLAGVGVGWLPDTLVAPELKSGALVDLSEEFPCCELRVMAIGLKSTESTRSLSAWDTVVASAQS